MKVSVTSSSPLICSFYWKYSRLWNCEAALPVIVLQMQKLKIWHSGGEKNSNDNNHNSRNNPVP